MGRDTPDVRVQVETVDGRTAYLGYPEEVWEQLREHLDDADSYVACLDCGDLATVEGLPETMPDCPLCGDPMTGVTDVHKLRDWQEAAAELREHGVPERRSQVVALVAQGATHAEVAAELDIDRRSVSTHVRRYREDLADAQWLAEHAPDI